MRLIDAEALKKAIIELDLDNTSHWSVIQKIDNAPTVTPETDRIEYGTDGQPYKLTISNGNEYQRPHGKWKKNKHTFWTCNKCNFVNGFNRVEYSFCPNCGAQMFKEGET